MTPSDTEKTDHGPEVVSHVLSVLQDGPEEEIPPGMLAALLHLRQVLLGVEQSALRWLFLEMTQHTICFQRDGCGHFTGSRQPDADLSETERNKWSFNMGRWLFLLSI